MNAAARMLCDVGKYSHMSPVSQRIRFKLCLMYKAIHESAPVYLSELREHSCVEGGGGAENAGVENAGVEKAGVDSRGGKCRSDNLWKAVRIENSKIPVVYAQTVCFCDSYVD